MTHVHLLRRLGFKESFAIVVGSMIGTGVFLKTAVMAQEAGSPALCFARVAGRRPALVHGGAGIRGAWLSVSRGWRRIRLPAQGVWPAHRLSLWMDEILDRIAGLNCCIRDRLRDVPRKFSAGGEPPDRNRNRDHRLFHRPQLLLGSVRRSRANRDDGRKDSHDLWAGGIDIDARSRHQLGSSRRRRRIGGMEELVRLRAAVLAALWAFDGWNNLSMAAGEIRNPNRVIPRALVWGLITVLLLYVGANLAYFYALPFSEVVNSNSTLHPDALPVATKAALQSFGGAAVAILSIAFVFSALGAMNGTILTGARVPYAMAQDGLMWSRLGEANEHTHSPVASTVVQGLWACVLAVSGTFDQLTNCIVFSSWIFYALATFGLFHFRRTLPAAGLSDAGVSLAAGHFYCLRAPADCQYALDDAEGKSRRTGPDRSGNSSLFPFPQSPNCT